MKKSDSPLKREKLKETEVTPKKTQNEKDKSGIYNMSTPRHFVSKTAVDIYGQNKSNSQNTKAPKKVPTTTQKIAVSPMKEFLKASPSSVSHVGRTDIKATKGNAKTIMHSTKQTPRTTRNISASSVTVNSPVIKRKLNLEQISSRKESGRTKNSTQEVRKVENSKEVRNLSKDPVRNKSKEGQSDSSKMDFARHRSETRTLNESEIKVLTAEMMDNNAEMLNLTRKLAAKPKSFYVDLAGEPPKPQPDKTSDEEVSYEDDFESYESDFDSYHSEAELDVSEEKDKNCSDGVDDDKDDAETDVLQSDELSDHGLKEVRDEERMLDSGSYDLRDRSAKAKPPVMENILEDTENINEKKASLTDEGFQEMSSSSAVSSIRNVDMLDRPFFIDLTKSKQNKRKRIIFERLKQRAEDLLSMISLHEMSYSLFEMKPVSYDTYMATFGRKNYTQTSIQTNEDSMVQETQTDEIAVAHKWTQNPVEFSKNLIYLYTEVNERKYSLTTVDYLTKFNYLINNNDDVVINGQININEDYQRNPLRIYLEQKDGVGLSEMLPYENYKIKLKSTEYNPERLKKFLKKIESRISNILSYNSGHTAFTDLVKNTKVPFSNGYIAVPCSKTYNDKYKFLDHSKITQAFFSESKINLIMTVHKVNQVSIGNKSLVCLWDISVANREPSKVLIVIDNIVIGRFSGNTDGIFVAALEDNTLHFWDLSEEATWRDRVANEIDATNLVEVDKEKVTEMERDREWNLKNSNVQNYENIIPCALHACSYTSSGNVISNDEHIEGIVALEFTLQDAVTQEGGRKIIRQVISLQRIGILTTWSIIQERSTTLPKNLGKAFWSKMKLEILQTVNLSDYIDLPLDDNREISNNFNLSAAKRRLSNRKQERKLLKRTLSRPKSAIRSEFEFDRSISATSIKNIKTMPVLPSRKRFKLWEVICNDLKILTVEGKENILVAKERGEVLCCKKSLGVMKVQRFYVTSDTSSITSLDVSPHGLPYFLAATDTGTVSLCSVLEGRVLLTLDGRNVPTTIEVVERCQSDHKGRYAGSVTKTPNTTDTLSSMNVSVESVVWSPVNPCCIYALLGDDTLTAWDLTSSDIYGRRSGQNATKLLANNVALAILTPQGEVQIHRFIEEQHTKEKLDLFKKYVSLL